MKEQMQMKKASLFVLYLTLTCTLSYAAIIALIIGIPAVLNAATGADVVPIKWARFSGPATLDSLTLQTKKLMQNAGKYFLNQYLDSCPINASGTFDLLPDPGGQDLQRIPSDGADILGIILATGAYDPAVIGRSEASARVMLARLIKTLASTHKSNGGYWGGGWQDAPWTAGTGFAAWLVWQDLDSITKTQVARMVENEANRFNYDPPYCNDCTDDTKAEENAWDAMVISLAVAMMPNHPNIVQWKTRGSQWMLSAYARESDLSSNVLVDGKLPGEWLTGWNAREAGYVYNHNIMHPDYMCSMALCLNTLYYQSLAGQIVSQAGIHNFDVVYKCFVDYVFTVPPWTAPGGTIYIPGKAGIYYPNGWDWSNFCVERFFQMDAIASVLPGVGDKVGIPASTWAKIRADTLTWMQSRFTTGQHYAPGEWDAGGQSPWKLAEIMGGRNMSESYLDLWLKAHNALMPIGNWNLAPDSTPPAIVTMNSPSVNQQTITLSWNAATDAESGINNYQIYRGTIANPTTLYATTGNVLTYQDETGMENTTFHYRVKAMNGGGLTSPDFSNDVSATTALDTVKPYVSTIQTLSAVLVSITFSKKVEQASSENIGNYTITPGVSVTAATRQADQKTVMLSVSSLSLGTTYSINVAGIRDQASIPDTMNIFNTDFSLQIPSLYHWQLDETIGLSASDATGHGNTARLRGSPVWGQGKYGNALTFDGVNDYLSTSLLQTNPNVFTLSLWFRTASTTGGKLIGLGNAQTGTSGHYDRHLYMSNDGKVYFGCYNGSVQTINTTLACNDNAWHYAAATLSSAGMALYIDGTLVGAKTTVTSGEINSGYWRMGFDDVTGWQGAPSSRYFSGQLDDIRVYDRALSASEIASLYDGGTENEPIVIAQENLSLEASPNPFNPSARISYYLPQKAVVSLTLYNMQGKLVRELSSGMVPAGRHTMQVEAGKLASGIYICEFRSGATAKRLKMVLMR